MGSPRRIAGLRVVMSWPDSEFTPPPVPRGRFRARLAGFGGAILLVGGALTIVVALLLQQHAPQPGASAAGRVGPATKGPSLHRSLPVSVDIPAIGVHSQLLSLGVNADAGSGYEIVTAADGTNSALAVLTVGGASTLYTINMTSGAATATGPVTGLNSGETLRGIAGTLRP